MKKFFERFLNWIRDPNSPTLVGKLKAITQGKKPSTPKPGNTGSFWTILRDFLARKKDNQPKLPNLDTPKKRVRKSSSPLFLFLLGLIKDFLKKQKFLTKMSKKGEDWEFWKWIRRGFYLLVAVGAIVLLLKILGTIGILSFGEMSGKALSILWWFVGITVTGAAIAGGGFGRWLAKRPAPSNQNPVDTRKWENQKRVGGTLQTVAKAIIVLMGLAILLLKTGIIGWFSKNGLYLLGALAIGLLLYFFSKHKIEFGNGVRGFGKIVGKAFLFIIGALAITAILGWALSVGSGENLLDHLSATNSLWLVVAGVAFAGLLFSLKGRAVKFFGVVIILVVYQMTGFALIKREQALAPPPAPTPATAKRWVLEVQRSSPRDGRPIQGFNRFNAEVLRWDERVISFKHSFFERGVATEGFFFWDKNEDPVKGYWYQNNPHREGSWTIQQVAPSQWAGEQTCKDGCHRYAIRLKEMP